MHYLFILLMIAIVSIPFAKQDLLADSNSKICPSIEKTAPSTTCSAFLKTMNISSDLITEFTTVFTKAMHNRVNVPDTFDTKIPKQVFAKLGYEVATQFGNYVGVKDPDNNAKLLSEVMFDTFPKLTPDLFVEFIGRLAGHYLMSEGALHEDNATDFADLLVNLIIKALYDSPTTIHALKRGLGEDFLAQMGLLTPAHWDTWHSHVIYHLYAITDNL